MGDPKKVGSTPSVQQVNGIKLPKQTATGTQTIQFPKGISDTGKKIREDVQRNFDEYSDKLDFNWNLIDYNCIELKLNKDNKLTYGDIKSMFHIPDKALTDAANTMNDPHFNLSDSDVPKRTVQIPVGSIGQDGNWYASHNSMTYDEVKEMYNNAKEKYKNNTEQVKNFIKDNKQYITYKENKDDKNGPYIEIHGDGNATMSDYKKALVLKDGVLKRDNPAFHGPDLDKRVVQENEFLKVYVKDMANIGIDSGTAKKAAKK
ncbi:MAG: hypothetical protein LBJ74_05565 [Heliobacteriaceae bacterium]|jgi:hypothetical protein|nr:hypothetical protein [Heliobacteriaceae bacterium]